MVNFGALILSEILYYEGTAKAYFLERTNYRNESTSLLIIIDTIYISLLSLVMYVAYSICYVWIGKLFVQKHNVSNKRIFQKNTSGKNEEGKFIIKAAFIGLLSWVAISIISYLIQN